MTKRIYLHVGFPKTGTKTLHNYLRAKEGELRKIGCIYPGENENEVFANHLSHQVFVKALTGTATPPSMDAFDASRCRKLVSSVHRSFRKSDEAHSLVWSSETLSQKTDDWDQGFIARRILDFDVTIVACVRYVDDYVESLFKQKIWGRTYRKKKRDRVYATPVVHLSLAQQVRDDPGSSARSTVMDQGMSQLQQIRAMQKAIPHSELKVLSFDSGKAAGTIVADRLAAFGVPLEGAFHEPDVGAQLTNVSISNISTMVLYHLQLKRLELDSLRMIRRALERRHDKRQTPAWLGPRRFGLLPHDAILQARANYEELRAEFPHLPAQPPYVAGSLEYELSREETIRFIDWLRPDISDELFEEACRILSA